MFLCLKPISGVFFSEIKPKIKQFWALFERIIPFCIHKLVPKEHILLLPNMLQTASQAFALTILA